MRRCRDGESYKIEDAKTTVNEKFTVADETFAGAWRDIAEAKQELAGGESAFARKQEMRIEKLRKPTQNLTMENKSWPKQWSSSRRVKRIWQRAKPSLMEMRGN